MPRLVERLQRRNPKGKTQGSMASVELTTGDLEAGAGGLKNDEAAAEGDDVDLDEEDCEEEAANIRQPCPELFRVFRAIWEGIRSNAAFLTALSVIAVSMFVILDTYYDDDNDEPDDQCLSAKDILKEDILVGALKSVCSCVHKPLRAA